VHAFHYRDGHLFCEEFDVAVAAERFGTPLYLYSASTILDHYGRLDKEMKQWICRGCLGPIKAMIKKDRNDGAPTQHIQLGHVLLQEWKIVRSSHAVLHSPLVDCSIVHMMAIPFTFTLVSFMYIRCHSPFILHVYVFGVFSFSIHSRFPSRNASIYNESHLKSQY